MLVSLLLIYQYGLGEKMEEERTVPQGEMRNILQGFRPNLMGENSFYQCHSCNKSICQICACFIHKHHDKVYTGTTGTCQHDQKKKAEPRDLEKERGERGERGEKGEERKQPGHPMQPYPNNYALINKNGGYTSYSRVEYRSPEYQRGTYYGEGRGNVPANELFRDRERERLREREEREDYISFTNAYPQGNGRPYDRVPDNYGQGQVEEILRA